MITAKAKHFDTLLFFVVVALMGIGLIMVYSASSVTSLAVMSDGLFYFKRQLLWVLIGIATLLAFSVVDYRKLEYFSGFLLAIAVFTLVLVLIPGVTKEIGGARRWIRFAGVGFQPSEFAKICMVIYLAASISRKEDRIKDLLRGVLPDLAITSVIFALILKEPNLSTAVISGTVYLVMLFLGNGSLLHLSAIISGGGVLVLSLVFQAGYRMRRFWAFWNPWESSQTSGYHIIQSLIAIGAGGFWGLGLGQSRQKFFILPERHTDFIFAIICEELGMIGGIAVLILFLLLFWRGFFIANRAPDMFGFMLASGITALIGCQTIINLGVVLSLLPTTGVTLPFVSYGGSSLVFLAAAVGILLNISRYGSTANAFVDKRKEPFSKNYSEPDKVLFNRRRI